MTRMQTQSVRWALPGCLALAAMALLPTTTPARANDAAPNAGRLEAWAPDGESLGPCPLKHTDVDAEIAGFVARVTVTQQFENPYDTAIEAVYTFPLSHTGAVDRMTMTVGERIIQGDIKKKEEARKIYEAARDAGKTAALLDEERPNIFTQSVANIAPGEAVTIEISYVELVKYEDGTYDFSFPMVVGPRYIPAGVPDASNIAPPVTPEGTRAGHDIDLRVKVDAGVVIRDVETPLHAVDVEKPSPSVARVALKNQKEIPNKDFILKYTVAGDTVEDAILSHVDDHGKFFSLILQPPQTPQPDAIVPKELMFVIDSSGSMRGFPIDSAKKAMRGAIESMHPGDTFNLVSFAGGTGYCFPEPVANTPKNQKRALAYLDGLSAGGGTEMMAAIQAALGGQNDPERLRVVCFMTDGYIGNDMTILGAIQKNAGTARVFSFGIGNSVNRFLIDGMAREGRGEAEIVTLASDGEAAAKRFHERIRTPLLTDIRVEVLKGKVDAAYPAFNAVPDVFSAKPITLVGRITSKGALKLKITGTTPTGPWERIVTVPRALGNTSNSALPSLWARRQVEDLMAKDWNGIQGGSPRADVRAAIETTGIEYGILTPYTSFVAVEETVVNENGRPVRVEVPVEMPEGVSYDGVFGDRAERVAGRSSAGLRVRTMAQASQAEVQFAPAPSPPATQPAPAPVAWKESGEPESDGDGLNDEASSPRSKLDPDLLALVNASDSGERTVTVFVEVTGTLADARAALEALGFNTKSSVESTKTLFGEISVGKLLKLAELSQVGAIRLAK